MATNPRIPRDESYQERKTPQLVPNTGRLKPQRPATASPRVIRGIVAVVLLAVAIYFLARTPKKTSQTLPPPVPSEIQLQGMQVIGGLTTGAYDLDGKISNTGPHSITGIVADVKLRDGQNRVIMDVQRPLQGMVVENRDWVSDPLTKDPVRPNATRAVRLGLDNVPFSWNRNLPEIEIVGVTAEGQK